MERGAQEVSVCRRMGAELKSLINHRRTERQHLTVEGLSGTEVSCSFDVIMLSQDEAPSDSVCHCIMSQLLPPLPSLELRSRLRCTVVGVL